MIKKKSKRNPKRKVALKKVENDETMTIERK